MIDGAGRTRRSARAGGAAVRGAVLVLVLAVAAACSSTPAAALVVDGWTLPKAAFLAELDQIAGNAGYVAARQAGDPEFRVRRPGSSEYEPRFVAEQLNERITFRLVANELQRRGVAVTDDDRRAATDVIVRQLTVPGPGGATSSGSAPAGSVPSGSVPPGGVDGRAVLDAFGSYRTALIEGVASIQVLQRTLAGGVDEQTRLVSMYEQLQEQVAEQSCVRHVLVRPDEAAGGDGAALVEAGRLQARIVAGEDFAAVAAEASDDTATAVKGGDLGCGPRGQYDGEFEAAVWSLTPGQISGPVRSTYGYHLVLVTERRILTFDELRDTLREGLAQQDQQALEQWLTAAAKAASVTVDPELGRWNAARGVVEPPSGANLELVPDRSGTTPGSLPGSAPR